jgi:hypothetical protein
VISQNVPRALQQLLAGFGQRHAPRRPHEEFDAQLIFQLPNLHADGRLRNVNSLGGSSEGAGLGNGHKSSQLTYFHVRLLLSGIVIVIIKSFSFHYT